MSEIIQFPGSHDSQPPRDIVDNDGDVKPIDDDPELSQDAQALHDALTERDADFVVEDPDMPPELRELLDEIDERTQQLQSYGAHDSEIKSKLTREYGARLAKLASHGIDIAAAPLNIFSIKSPSVEQTDAPQVIPLSSEEERERRIEDYMDKRGVSRVEAERSIE